MGQLGGLMSGFAGTYGMGLQSNRLKSHLMQQSEQMERLRKLLEAIGAQNPTQRPSGQANPLAMFTRGGPLGG